MNKLVSEQKQPLPFTRFDPAFDLVGAAVAKKTGNIALRSCRFAAAHKQLEHVLTNNFLFFQTGIFFTQPVKTLNIAVMIENNDDGVGFRDNLFSKREALSQVTSYGGRIVPR